MTDRYLTVRAAEDLLASAEGKRWDLGDAILADVPADLPADEVRRRLDEIEEALAQAGVTTPNGEPYVAAALAAVRQTAIFWPPESRHPEAAFRTHQECQRTPSGRAALDALVRVARGEEVACPEDVDETAFDAARGRVLQRQGRARRPRYTVTANDLRVAMKRTVNIPERRDRSDVMGLLGEVSTASQALRTFARRFVEAEPSEEERASIMHALERLMDRAEQTLAVVSATGADLSVEALENLLKEGVDD
jgi:hypothetical protein